MGYWIENQDGDLMGDFASISGLREFRTWARSQGGAVSAFIDSGLSEDPAAVAAQLKGCTEDGDIGEMCAELARIAEACEVAMVLTDGTAGDYEGEEAGQEASAGDDMTAEDRERWAKTGEAMNGGEYPIRDAHAVSDLKHAIQAIGRAKDRAAVERHIRKRAKETGHEDLLPDWAQAAGAEPAVTPAGYTTADAPPSYKDGWHAVDLDGTLATHTSNGSVGKPIPAMVERVKKLLEDGKDVRIFTARKFDTPETRQAIESFCSEHLGKVLPITNVKHPGMRAFYDDKGISVVKNTGELRHPLTPTMKAEADGETMSNDETQELAGNPYHAKDGKFTTAGGMKGRPVTMVPKGPASKASSKIDAMNAASFGTALRAVTGRSDFAAQEIGTIRQITKVGIRGQHEVVRAKSWSAALRLATAKWGIKR